MNTFTEIFLRSLRYHLNQELSSFGYRIKPSHMAEALAKGLDFKSAIALAQWAQEPADKRKIVFHSLDNFQKPLLKQYNDVDSTVLDYSFGFFQYFFRCVIRALEDKRAFKHANASELAQIFILLMDKDDMQEPEHNWTDAVTTLWQVVFEILCFQRDTNAQPITFSCAIDLLSLRSLLEIYNNQETTRSIKDSIKNYLLLIPSYQSDKSISKQSQTSLDFHGYLEMQFTRYRNY